MKVVKESELRVTAVVKSGYVDDQGSYEEEVHRDNLMVIRKSLSAFNEHYGWAFEFLEEPRMTSVGSNWFSAHWGPPPSIQTTTNVANPRTYWSGEGVELVSEGQGILFLFPEPKK